ncbi:MAG: hypothetical protein JWO73_951 [Candidatus Taylorbacteria bacterium]|nr:hypothetical protein [Candidatus Taylorbacteria bacterium]
MSTHKTIADTETIASFLKIEFPSGFSDLEVITGGEGSQAYSFAASGTQYIIRINKHHTLGFRKDEYAFSHLASPSIPIPKIFKIGKITSGLRFCISERVEGKTLNSFAEAEFESFLPVMFDVLDAVHAVDVSGSGGYGKWGADGQAEGGNWKEYLMTVDKYAKGMQGTVGLFETTFLEKDFWDSAYARLAELVRSCPEARFLVHGDYGSNNVLSDGRRITGVIDWESSMYGDFLYDVAWLSFWSRSLDFQSLYLEHSKKKGMQIENYAERMLCYKLYIGLSSLSFYAYSGQKEKYAKTKGSISRLLGV